jgi:AcrR family transcriptional regulator
MDKTSKARRRPGRPADPERRIERRKSILAQAVRHFAREGFDGADIGAIARAAGCSKGTVYNHFASKQDVFRQSVDHVMNGLIETIESSAVDDPVESFGRAVRAFLRYFNENPEFIELLILERAVFKDRAAPSYHEYIGRHREEHKDKFLRLMAEGVFRQRPVERLFDMIGDLLYGTIFTNYFAKRTSCLEEQAKEITDLLLHGLLTPGARAS